MINNYANGELTDKDLQKMIVANDEHLKAYESQGIELRKKYIKKAAKSKQMKNSDNKNVDKQTTEGVPPFDISLPGYTR